MKGYVHIYTGDGKGKTTGAIGLAMRSLMRGRKVFMGQFIKGMYYGELDLQKTFENLTIHQYGTDCFIDREVSEEDRRRAWEGLTEMREVLREGWDMVILDEICVAIDFSLLSWEEVKDALDERNPKTEVVLTGRGATEDMIAYADLVTEMREVKHYYQEGIQARAGIEF